MRETVREKSLYKFRLELALQSGDGPHSIYYSTHVPAHNRGQNTHEREKRGYRIPDSHPPPFGSRNT